MAHSSLSRKADVKMAPVLDSAEPDGLSMKKKEETEEKENLW